MLKIKKAGKPYFPSRRNNKYHWGYTLSLLCSEREEVVHA